MNGGKSPSAMWLGYGIDDKDEDCTFQYARNSHSALTHITMEIDLYSRLAVRVPNNSVDSSKNIHLPPAMTPCLSIFEKFLRNFWHFEYL